MSDTPDFIPDNEFTPDAPKAQTVGSAPDFISDDEFVSDEDKHSTLGQQVLTGVEGAAQGFAGPIATALESGLSGVGIQGLSPEEQHARAEANPWISGLSKAGGMGAGLLTGAGELGVLAKVGELGVAASGIGEATTAAKIGSAALTGLLETAGYQLGEEATKFIQHDPEQSVSSALANTGFAGLIGGGLGGGLSIVGMGAAKGLRSLSDTQLGQRAGQLLTDFGNRWKFNEENPQLFDAVKNELTDFYGSTKAVADDVYGPMGLKAQVIEKLVPEEMTSAITNQNQKIADTLQSKLAEMVKDPESYPMRLTKKLQTDADQWMQIASNPQVSPNQVFNATQELKQTLQAYSKFDRMVGPLSPEKEFIQVAKELQHGLVKNLEDPNVWGQAGELQKGVNSAFRDFLPAQSDFLSRFTTKVQGEPVIDPGKVNTYINQLGKANAEIKQGMMEDYINAAEKYRERISDLHGRLGVESPVTPASLNATKGTYGDTTIGQQLADKVFHGWAPGFAARTGQGLVGAEIGREHGGLSGAVAGGMAGMAAPYLEKALLKKLTSHGVPAVLKVMAAGRPAAIAEALEHAQNVKRGSTLIENGVNSLFTGSKLAIPKAANANVEKIRKYVEGGGLNKQIQNQNQMSGVVPEQNFAQGGEVKAPVKNEASSDYGRFGEVYPEQNMLMNSAKSRVFGYLNSVKPAENPQKLPFDHSKPDKPQQKSYEKALHLAANPIGILHSIKDGSLTPQEMKHFTQMWPEMHNQLSKKMTEKIMQSQVDGVRPKYSVRQAMSLFLGAPLDSTMTPGSIQAAQGVFASQKMQQPVPGSAPKKNTSKLGKVAEQYRTPSEAAQIRQQST